jgi:hypothetical protein
MTKISKLHDDLTQVQRERAKELWNAAGRPENRNHEFWFLADDTGPFRVCHKALDLEKERKKRERKDVTEQHTAELHIKILPGGQATDAQIALFDRTRQVEIGIRRVLFPDLAGCNKPKLMRPSEWDRRKLCHNDYMQWLTDAARVGLEHPKPQIALADRDLDNLCWDVLTRYGRHTRTDAVRAYGMALLCWIAGIALLSWAIANLVVSGWLTWWPTILHVDQNRLVTYIISLAGAAGGALLVFTQRSLTEDWPSLVAAASDTVRAYIRAGYVLGFTFVALLMLRTGMVEIKVAAFKSVDAFPSVSATVSIVSAILIGAFFGLADRTLPTLVQQNARDTAGRLKGTS